MVAALPTLPADAVDARQAVADDLARIDAVAHLAIEAARGGAADPTARASCTSCSMRPPSTPSTPTS